MQRPSRSTAGVSINECPPGDPAASPSHFTTTSQSLGFKWRIVYALRPVQSSSNAEIRRQPVPSPSFRSLPLTLCLTRQSLNRPSLSIDHKVFYDHLCWRICLSFSFCLAISRRVVLPCCSRRHSPALPFLSTLFPTSPDSQSITIVC